MKTGLTWKPASVQRATCSTAPAQTSAPCARHESAKRRYAGFADDLRDTLHSEGHLSDRYVTQRDDRHVLPVKAASKRQFGGVVHDASRSGKTAYVEPAQLIEAGAQVRKTEDAVHAEEQRPRVKLSSLVALHATELGDDIRILGTLDADRARGAFSRTFDGVAPRFHERGIRLQALPPPALLLAGLERVVPVDMTLEAPTRVLIISGPNGGGKSVALTACVGFRAGAARRTHPCATRRVTGASLRRRGGGRRRR